MQGRCDKHLFESAEDRCGKCGYEYCAECLVYAFGPKKPPFCIPCAVAAAGIRTTAGVKAMAEPREMRQLRKERRSVLRRARKDRSSGEVMDPTPIIEGLMPAPPAPVLPAQY